MRDVFRYRVPISVMCLNLVFGAGMSDGRFQVACFESIIVQDELGKKEKEVLGIIIIIIIITGKKTKEKTKQSLRNLQVSIYVLP